MQPDARTRAGGAGPRARRAAGGHRARPAARASAARATRAAPDRDFGDHVIRAPARRPAPVPARPADGRASGPSTCCAARTRSRPPRSPAPGSTTTCATETGPFDVIGDIHGCRAELETLLAELGLRGRRATSHGRAVGASHPERRRAVFVGDLVDRGPDTPGVLRLVMGMVGAGDALCVPGNHENKLLRALRGRKVQITHGLAESLAQLDSASPGVPGRRRAVHRRPGQPLRPRRRAAGGRARRPDRALPGPRVGPGPRASACTGRRPARPTSTGCRCATRGRGVPRAGDGPLRPHARSPRPEWVNNTICLDTGCVFGGRLTALRYPEREIVSRAGRAGVLRAGQAVPGQPGRRGPAARTPRAATCSTSATSPARRVIETAYRGGSACARRTPPPRSR